MNHGALSYRDHYQPIEQEARTLFLEDPNLSVDDVARALSHKYRDTGITKQNISRIRQAVRLAIGQSTPAATPIKRRPFPREPFNAIKGLAQPAVAPPPIVAEPASSTHEERIHFLEDYALSHINATIDEARQALKKRFGQAVGTKAISDALAIVKTAAKQSKPEIKPDLSAVEGCTNMVDVVRFMRRNGLQQITVLDSGSFKIVPFEE